MRPIRFAAVGLALVLAAGCGGGSSPGTNSSGSTVHVLYAGSLVNLMEKQIGPAFATASGDRYQGYGSDSQSVANAIKGRVQTGDVFISASTQVNATLQGASNGDWERWYAEFATAPLEIGYSAKSKFASALKSDPWYDVLQDPGIRIGITDPTLDPKGELTVQALRAAARVYHLPRSFASTIQHKASVFPEQDMLGRLEAGQLDVGFFYTNEAVPAHLATVSLGKVHEAATFTVTVLQKAPDPAGAVAFVRYLLTDARSTLTSGGMHVLAKPVLSGPPSAVPTELRSLLG